MYPNYRWSLIHYAGRLDGGGELYRYAFGVAYASPGVLALHLGRLTLYLYSPKGWASATSGLWVDTPYRPAAWLWL